ncbi:hypothetical protein LXL04_008219 [Taraxacum kok-saghyz]
MSRRPPEEESATARRADDSKGTGKTVAIREWSWSLGQVGHSESRATEQHPSRRRGAARRGAVCRTSSGQWRTRRRQVVRWAVRTKEEWAVIVARKKGRKLEAVAIRNCERTHPV